MALGGDYLLSAVLLLCFFVVPTSAMVPVWNLTTEGALLTDIAISDDGSRVITGSAGGDATVYDRNGTVLWETRVPGALFVGTEGNGTSYLLVSREDPYKNKGSIRVYNQSGSLVSVLHTGWVEGLKTAPDRYLIGTFLGDLIVVNRSGIEVAQCNDTPKTYPVSGLSLSADGKVFGYSLVERYPQVRYVTIASNSKRTFSKFTKLDIAHYGADESISKIAISREGGWVATSGGEGSHGVLCLYAKNGTRMWSKDTDEILDLAVTANGTAVFEGTRKGDIIAFSPRGNISWIYSAGSPVTSLSLSADKDVLAAGTARGDLYLFNQTGTLLWRDRLEAFPVAAVSRVVISRDAQALVAKVNDRHLYYFEQEPEPEVVETPTVIPTRNDTFTYTYPAAPAMMLSFLSLMDGATSGLWDQCQSLQAVIPSGQEQDQAGASPLVWLDGYSSRKTHAINGSPAGNQEDYPVKVIVHRSNGTDGGEDVYLGEAGCLADYRDIRFTDAGETLLDYWIESNNTQSALIWVNVPTIPLNGTEIRMYYGNENATSESNGEATFLFFDHFEGPEIDKAKWNVSGTPQISESVLELNTTKGAAYIVSKTTWPVNTAYGSYGVMNSSINSTWQGYYNNSGPFLMFYPENPNLRAITKNNKSQSTPLGKEYEGWTKFEIIRNGTANVTYSLNGTVVADHTTPLAISPDPISIQLRGTVNSQFRTDYLFVRPYVFPEPTHGNWSAQESLPADCVTYSTPLTHDENKIPGE